MFAQAGLIIILGATINVGVCSEYKLGEFTLRSSVMSSIDKFQAETISFTPRYVEYTLSLEYATSDFVVSIEESCPHNIDSLSNTDRINSWSIKLTKVNR